MADLLGKLGGTIIPGVFDKLSGVGVVDTMTVLRDAPSTDSGGGRIKGAVTTPYTTIPVDVTPTSTESRYIAGDKPRSHQEYILEFPTHDTSGTRIVIDTATDRLRVNSNKFPDRTFRIIAVAVDHGVTYKATCTQEDDE